MHSSKYYTQSGFRPIVDMFFRLSFLQKELAKNDQLNHCALLYKWKKDSYVCAIKLS